MGSNAHLGYMRILEHCRENGLRAEFCLVPENRLAELTAFLPDAQVITDKAWDDYLYDAEDLRTMAGRKYSGQRNHISKFVRAYPDWSFEKVDERNMAETRAFFEGFIGMHVKDSVTLTEGDRKTLEVLDNFDAYGLFAGVLWAGSRIVGFSLGETVCDTLFIHTEKSDRNFPGSYQVLVREFARLFAGDGIKYINREEDDGDEGLRISKQSYHPVRLLQKYTVREAD